LILLSLGEYKEIDDLKSIGYLTFFMVYTAREDLYRKYGWMLLLFISAFLLS